jgi:uncharacterized protein (TIGR02265 family)
MDKVVFGPSLEALWRAMDPLTAAEAQAFKDAGVVGGRFDAAYPLAPYLKILEASATSRFGHLQEQDAYVQVGHLFVEGFTRTVIGQALMGIMRLLGPRRTMQRLTRNFRAANNYTEVSVTTLRDNHHQIAVNFVEKPGFYIGVLERTLAHAGAKNAEVTMIAYVDRSPTFEVRWS